MSIPEKKKKTLSIFVQEFFFFLSFAQGDPDVQRLQEKEERAEIRGWDRDGAGGKLQAASTGPRSLTGCTENLFGLKDHSLFFLQLLHGLLKVMHHSFCQRHAP